MPTIFPTIRTTVALASVLFSAAAIAHPQLLSSSPSDKAEVPAPQKIELRFSEKLTTQFSGATLIMTGMPGMPNHGSMKVPARVSGSEDPKSMIVTPIQTLAPGSYKVDWRAVSSDTHPINGSISFTVK